MAKGLTAHAFDWPVNCEDCNAEIDGETCQHCSKCGEPLCADCAEMKNGLCDQCYTGE